MTKDHGSQEKQSDPLTTQQVSDKDQTQEAKAQLSELASQLKTSVDNDKFPQANDYIEKTKNYFTNILDRVEKSDDKDKTSQEIADEMVSSFTGWLEKKQKELEEQKKQQGKEQAN